MSSVDRAIWIKQNGKWHPVNMPMYHTGGQWANITEGYYHLNGTWQKFFPSAGYIAFDQGGTYTFTVPPGIYNLNVDLSGAGGGGGGAEEVGVGSAGGGGGGGGYILNQSFPVVPLETITIQVGQGGAGAPYVGRTTGAPDGSAGGTTTITGSLGSLSAAGGSGGSGGHSADSGGGGGKIICTKLYELGLMDREIYEADQAFGAELVKVRPDIYNGYRAWAEIVVDWMDGKGPKMMPWMSNEEFSKAASRWSTTWAEDIATPWAEEMAFKMGKKSEGSLTGKMITAAGIPICKAVGVWQRVFGPSKKPAGFVKGAMLIPVFIMFKLVAELGRALEKKKEQQYV